MPTIGSTLSPDEVKLEYIKSVCEEASKENWSLSELAGKLQVHERTARRYLDQFGLDTAVLIRPKRSGEE